MRNWQEKIDVTLDKPSRQRGVYTITIDLMRMSEILNGLDSQIDGPEMEYDKYNLN